MRKDVIAWKKQLKQENGSVHRNDTLQENFKSFEGTFKAARSILERPENEFPMVSKRKRLDTCYIELHGWYTGIQFLMRPKPEMKKETEIKDLLPASLDIKLKKETKINSEHRGGRREGAGRKSLGVKKPVSITLPEDTWNEIDNLIQSEKFKSYADYFRSLVLDSSRG
ncbi:hypothetical protein D3C81_1688020 [compost metagenome]